MARSLGRSAGLISRTGQQAALTGGFTLVTQITAPGNVLFQPPMTGPWQFVYMAATLVPARTTSARLIVCYGGSGSPYEFAQRIYPDEGLQLVLDWEEMRANLPGPLSVYADGPGDANVILVKCRAIAPQS